MPIIVCKPCQYSSSKKSFMDSHFKSKKHQTNSLRYDTDPTYKESVDQTNEITIIKNNIERAARRKVKPTLEALLK